MHASSEENTISGAKEGQGARQVTARGRGGVRRANFSDLKAILNINDDVYDGIDYMPAFFYIFMHNKNYSIYVYELDGQLVALCSFYFVPGTEDLVTIMSLRVRPSFQGQGFGRPERNPITDQFRKEHPEVKRYIIQTWFKPNIQAKIHQFKVLYHWHMLHHRITDRSRLAKLPNLLQDGNLGIQPMTLSYTASTNWLTRSDKLVNFLSRYADEYIVGGAKLVPVKVNATDLRKLFTFTDVCASFADTNGKPVDGKTFKIPPSGQGVVPAVDDDVEIVGVSWSAVLQCKHGLSVAVHYYGDSQSNLLSHVYSHVTRYVSVIPDDVGIACTVHFPLTIDVNGVRERLTVDLGDRYFGSFNVDDAVHYVTPFDP